MGYGKALEKAWSDLRGLSQGGVSPVRFLADEYTIDIDKKEAMSASCNVPAKEHVSILVLHYAIRKIKGLSQITGEWISFRQLGGGEGYYPVFKKRVIDRIARKHGKNPESIFDATQRLGAKKAQVADISVVIEAFEGVPVLITLQRQDEEFAPEANVLFDSSIRETLCTEDIVVMSEFIAAQV
ncbi:DUF3786 domain-containing protein [Candidatus Omnitrophota bacterium]